MDLKVQSKIFYPSHGAGWVKSKRIISFAGQEKEYLDFEFINNPLSISTPIDNVDSLGIRSVKDTNTIVKAIEVLAKQKSIDPKVRDFNQLIIILDQLELKATIDDFVTIIQYCNHERKNRLKEGRLVPSTIDKHTKNSISNLIGELAVSSEVSYDDAQTTFQKITGIK